jgi:hypothetical protein
MIQVTLVDGVFEQEKPVDDYDSKNYRYSIKIKDSVRNEWAVESEITHYLLEKEYDTYTFFKRRTKVYAENGVDNTLVMEITSVHQGMMILQMEIQSLLVRAFQDVTLKMVTGTYFFSHVDCSCCHNLGE